MASLPSAAAPVEPAREKPRRRGVDVVFQVVGISGLLVAAYLAVSKLPLLFAPTQVPVPGTAPSAGALLAVGLVVTALSAGIVYLAIGFKASFSKLVVVLAIAYNALIVLVKFVLGPPGVWHQVYIAGFSRSDNATPGQAATKALSDAGGSAIGQAVGLFCVYAFVFLVIYLGYRFRTTAILRRLIRGRPPRRFLAVPLAGLFLFSGSLIFVAVFVVPFMAGSPYVRDLFTSAAGVLAAVMLAGAVSAAVAVFQLASQRAILVRDAGLLTALFWVGIALLAVYHILWVVYILTLLAMYPVKFTIVTYGK